MQKQKKFKGRKNKEKQELEREKYTMETRDVLSVVTGEEDEKKGGINKKFLMLYCTSELDILCKIKGH